MKILRTCGSGEFHNDERLVRFRDALKILHPEVYEKIAYVNDHKGLFYIYWCRPPALGEQELIEEFISTQLFEHQIENYLIKWEDIYKLTEFS
jgi:hypothetical protein